MVNRLLKYGLLEIEQETASSEAGRSVRVRQRYDSLAPYVTLVDHLLMMSVFRVRERAIKALPLRTADTVVELGCGTGRNFSHLRKAVGENGRIIGVEFSPGMLARAAKLAEQEALEIELVDQDISRYALPPANLVLLSLCYHTLEFPTQTLTRIWDALQPGACLAIIDGKPPDFADGVVRPFGAKVLESVFMGDAAIKPWENLARLGSVNMKKFVLGAYYVCWAIKQ
jgi:demethylmenaquinone methyltransferase/2-methoxy-6-polyprenyl-1,4-benzoquinol methylase